MLLSKTTTLWIAVIAILVFNGARVANAQSRKRSGSFGDEGIHPKFIIKTQKYLDVMGYHDEREIPNY